MTPDDNQGAPPPVSGVVAMIPVRSVEDSAAFYARLGFAIGNRVPAANADGSGPAMQWAWLYIPGTPDWRRGANLMLTRCQKPVALAGPRAIFYVYVTDLVALRTTLIQAGDKPSEISYPFYLPKGECELIDPDGHCLMLAQNAPDTP